MTTARSKPQPVQRQIVLPITKAVEIAYKSIRQRLSRSLLVTSGIVLALAFLMSILTTQKLYEGMRDWIHITAVNGSASPALRTDAQTLEQLMATKGVPTSQADIEADRIQTRWLLSLALMVAFVGILNAMLMSVTERFREIGTMKCLGALDSFIIKLFLIESLFQGIVGTTLGVILGLLLSFLSAINNYGGYIWKHLPVAGLLENIALCVLVGVVLTVAGAVYPAWQAARMQPIEAMRVDT